MWKLYSLVNDLFNMRSLCVCFSNFSWFLLIDLGFLHPIFFFIDNNWLLYKKNL